LFAVVLVAAALAGCGGTSEQATRTTLAALDAGAPPQTKPKPTPPSPICSASLRPTGAMPTGSFMAQIRAKGKLIAGVDQNTKLLSYYNPARNRIEGFEIDLLQQIARAIPAKLALRAVTTSERIPYVQDGTVDIVADAMTTTCDRAKQVDFSSTYYDAWQRVLVPINSPVKSIQDLNGKRVCATQTSTSVATIQHFAPRAIPVLVPQRTDCLVDLQQGVVDAISTDDAILLGFKAQDPDTTLVGSRIAPEPYGLAIKNTHPEFVQFVNGVLARMRADGTWTRLYKRWFGPPITTTTPSPPVPTYDG
jgi:polar amino acid transport system substrate-binding protein